MALRSPVHSAPSAGSARCLRSRRSGKLIQEAWGEFVNVDGKVASSLRPVPAYSAVIVAGLAVMGLALVFFY